MAIVGVIMGSTIGFFTAVLGCLVWDMSVLSSFALYVCISLCVMALTIAIGLLCQNEDSPATNTVEAY